MLRFQFTAQGCSWSLVTSFVDIHEGRKTHHVSRLHNMNHAIAWISRSVNQVVSQAIVTSVAISLRRRNRRWFRSNALCSRSRACETTFAASCNNQRRDIARSQARVHMQAGEAGGQASRQTALGGA
jgi:hypothetical protein